MCLENQSSNFAVYQPPAGTRRIKEYDQILEFSFPTA